MAKKSLSGRSRNGKRRHDWARGSRRKDDVDGDHHMLSRKFGGEAKGYDQIDAAPEEKRAASPSTPRTLNTKPLQPSLRPR